MLLLAGRDRYTQRTLLRDVHDRLANQPGCGDVRYRPSRRRPRYVIADIDPPTFLGSPYEAASAELEVRFWYPADVEYEYYRINWIEPARSLMLGFHRDADHQNLGPCHVQLDYEDEPVARYETPFLDTHPLSVLDERLRQLPSVLDSIRWEDDQPSISTDRIAGEGIDDDGATDLA